MYTEKFIRFIQTVTPGYKVVKKEDSRLMRFLAAILFFNKNFMSGYITTIYKTVYVPEALIHNDENVAVLAHEAQHVWDLTRNPIITFLGMVGYLVPQIFVLGSLLSLLAIWYSSWWLLALLCLIFIAPLPAPIRMIIERRGYLMSLAVGFWRYRQVGVSENGWPVTMFTGNGYYYMWPFKKNLANWFRSELKKITEGKYPSPVFKAVHEFLKSENLASEERK